MASTNSNDVTEDAISISSTPAITSSPLHRAPENLYNILSLDSRLDKESGSWKHTKTADPNIPAEQVESMGAEATALDSDSWRDYCFVVVKRQLTSWKTSREIITFRIFLMSPYLVKACQEVMTDLRGVSWKSEPIKLDPKMVISYFPRLENYERNLTDRKDRTEEDTHILKSVRILLAHMRKHYRQTLARIDTLVKNHEITFDLLYAILLPGTIITQHCPFTGEPLALKLLDANQCCCNEETYWNLECEYLELATSDDTASREGIRWGDNVITFGMGKAVTRISQFNGVEKINTLAAYPIEFYSNPVALRNELRARARKWMSLGGVHHVYYTGTAGHGQGKDFRRYSVRSRIMVDKASFSRINPSYGLRNPLRILPMMAGSQEYGLTEADLLLAPAIVYGFSLTDKRWLEFNVTHVAPIEWNDEAFDGLVLPPERKALLRGLIEAHSASHQDPASFDDFVRGKGRGLVINLFGPPGVGKTLSAEVTSERLRRPLYVVGSGDLGTSAGELDKALLKAFDLAATWRAVLLIDEADVFLEERSLHDLERNATVAVFLRQLEYYQGILFMTTNRIRTFDEAFLSRIHVSLYFDDLDVPTKLKIWRAFLGKAGLGDGELEEGLLSKLAARDINGRQIKNACSTAASLAASRNEKMTYEHLELVLGAMEEFMKYFKPEQVPDRPPEIEEEQTRFGSVRTWWGKRLVSRVNKYLKGSRSA